MASVRKAMGMLERRTVRRNPPLVQWFLDGVELSEMERALPLPVVVTSTTESVTEYFGQVDIEITFLDPSYYPDVPDGEDA